MLLFYLSQSFEKANKSLLALIKTEYLSDSEKNIEAHLSTKIGHDKRKATKEVVDFLWQMYPNMEFEQIKI